MPEKKKQHVYKLKYDIETECGEFSAEELKEEGVGGTDAFVFISMINPADGSYSQTFFSKDGRTDKEVDSASLFKAWMLVGSALAKRDDLSAERRALAGFPMKMACGKCQEKHGKGGG